MPVEFHIGGSIYKRSRLSRALTSASPIGQPARSQPRAEESTTSATSASPIGRP